MTHPRLSVHDVTFMGMPLAERNAIWQRIGLTRLSLIASDLAADDGAAAQALIASRGYRVEAVTHVFSPGPLPVDPAGIAACRDALVHTIEVAGRLGARTIYMLTGGRGDRTWRQAAEAFCGMIHPCLAVARREKVALTIENASNLYVDIHLAHTLRDTLMLAKMCDLGICLDHFHAWTEPDFPKLVKQAMPRVKLIQLSDYVLGDRALPARAVPGDGAIPIRPFVEHALALGYRGGFDLELPGPRIEAEGRAAAAKRACAVISAMLDELGA